MKKGLFLAGVVVAVLSGKAYAMDRITESDIRDFYATSTQIHKESFDVYEAFIDEHFHDHLKVELKMIHKIKGMPTQKQTLMLDKAQYTKQARQDYESTRDMDSENTVLKVKLSPDGKEALVKDISYMSGRVDMPALDGSIKMYLEIKALCADRLVLNKGVLQVLQSKCHVENNMAPLP